MYLKYWAAHVFETHSDDKTDDKTIKSSLIKMNSVMPTHYGKVRVVSRRHNAKQKKKSFF